MVRCAAEEGCERSDILARGLCGKHYQRLRKYGHTSQGPIVVGDLERRFWSYVERGGQGCWPWVGNRDKDGYGVLTVEGKRRRATRVLWCLLHPEDAPLPRRMLVCHSCDNPSCVRPDHLWLGSNDANMQDCTIKGRRPVGDRNGTRTKPGSLRFAEQHHNSKLTREQAAEIARRRAAGERRDSLAAEFGVSGRYIYCITKGETWHSRKD